MENRRGIIDKVKGENFALSRGRSFSRSPGNCGKELVSNPYDFASAYGKLDAYEREREWNGWMGHFARVANRDNSSVLAGCYRELSSGMNEAGCRLYLRPRANSPDKAGQTAIGPDARARIVRRALS